MYQKKHNNSNLTIKIDLLQSNVNRLVHQHDALCRLVQDTQSISRLKSQAIAVEQTMKRMAHLRQNTQITKNSKELYRNKNKLSGDVTLEKEVRNIQIQISKIKQQLNRRKKQQNYETRNYVQKLENDFNEVRKKNLGQIQALKKNVDKYLQNVKKDIKNNHQTRVLDFVNNNLIQRSTPYCEDIQAEIGLLICEIQYKNYLQTKTIAEKQIQNVQDRFAGSEQQQRKQLQFGKIQREIMKNNLKQFYHETSTRIIYDCHLILQKIQLAIQCVKVNIKSKGRATNMFMHYDENSKQFKRKISAINFQIQGMKLKIKQMIQKLKILDAKIKILDPNQGEYTNQVKEDYSEIQMNYLLCQQRFQDFNKLKIQFIYQSN